MEIADYVRPYTEVVLAQVPEAELFDAHTHVGFNDPDGMRQSPDELLSNLRAFGARGVLGGMATAQAPAAGPRPLPVAYVGAWAGSAGSAGVRINW